MTLVKDARRAWRWFSVQAMIAAGALQGAWSAIPDDLKSKVPEDAVAVITMLMLTLGIVGRLVHQPD